MKILKSLFLSILLLPSIKIISMEISMPHLHKAVMENNLEKVRFLIEQGCDTQEVDELGRTAFDYAVSKKEYKKIAAHLYPYYFDLKALQKTIGYEFKDLTKLIKAFTPRVICCERNYETYEWVGDAILHEVLTLILYKGNYGVINEGLLSQARSVLEQKETLAELSQRLGLDKFVIGGKLKTDILEDVLEALVAAIYKDGGTQPVQAFIMRYWLPLINTSSKLPMSPVLILKKWEQETKRKVKSSYIRVGDICCYSIEYDQIESFTTALIEPASTRLASTKLAQRIARYYAARKFIIQLSEKYSAYKDLLLISPLSDQYKFSSVDSEYTVDMGSWEAQDLFSLFSYNLSMISQMLGYYKPIFKIEKSGEDHNSVFICSVQFEGIEGKRIGEPAKTKKKAREHAAYLAFEEWRSNAMNDLDIAKNWKIDIKKLIFLVKIKKHLDLGNKNSRVLLKELTEYCGYDKVSYKDYIQGGKLSDSKTGLFYSKVLAPSILGKPLKSEHCANIKKAQEDAAQKVMAKFLDRVHKGN